MSFQFSFLKAPTAANTAKPLTEYEPQISELAELAASPASTPTAAEEAFEPVQVSGSEHGSAVYERRQMRFASMGLPDAEALADRLALRDFDIDDRTLCVECSHFRPRGCAVRDCWLPDVFQRCDRFTPALAFLNGATP
ncbi:hypothetical protein [Polaromonas sp.]|uniref:hypothetical protein n=1 Tax=Polaromonas sp. TaxID=1869339 RepID=UPI002486FD61|nr:hypothetical protein [Polaromonas sp.]MDI1339356.1 hypothetical protein [Polaromonas sp.]